MDLRIIEHLVTVMGTTPGRVLPGKKNGRSVGNKITTIQKLKVILLKKILIKL
jgi:hypothetical protein